MSMKLTPMAASFTRAWPGLLSPPVLGTWFFLVLGAYFVHFWSRTGQTLPMQTWNIRLVTSSGQPVSPLRAACRYLLAWLWFLPGLAAAHLAGIRGGVAVSVILVVGVLTYALLSLLHPTRQFLHDALCGTRLIEWKTVRKR